MTMTMQEKWDKWNEAEANYEDYYKRKGVTKDLVGAYEVLAKVLFNECPDKKYAVRISSRARDLIEELACKETEKQDIWHIERLIWDKEGVYEYLERYYGLLLLEAPHNFESFLFYMDRRRPQDKRFYWPRRKTLKVVADDLQDLEDGTIKFYGLSMPSRVGKLLADDTPVLTTNGWKKHGDLGVGDYVFGLDGSPKRVQFIHPKNYANKRVWFSDHTYIDCHENHEWLMYDRNLQQECVVETKYIESKLKTIESGRERNRWYLPCKQVIEGNKDIELRVNPYVFGAWLGDGNNTKPDLTICNTDTSIVDKICECGYSVSQVYEQEGCKRYAFSGLRADLQQYGMCHSRRTVEKRIPSEYLCASVDDRLELLAGLLDTDGTLRKTEHRYSYSTINENLKDDIVALVSTFGWRVCVVKYDKRKSSSGIVGRHDVYTISFNPTMHIPCVVDRKKLYEFSTPRRISVEKIETIEPKQGNCITVDGGIYRVGERMTPTHNSTICIFFLAWVMGRSPNKHSAMGGHSGILAKGFYGELLNLIETEEYTYAEIFPNLIRRNGNIVQRKSADEYTINLDKPDRFSTLTCRGIDGTWTGAVDISPGGYLYVDDLVRDREHSLSPTRMEGTFQEYLNKMVDRKNDGAKELMVGTLWSVLDPLSRIAIQYDGNPKYRFRKIPALNENDESNFDYIHYGFSTQYYRDMRERLDNAEWMAKYQQQPYVREGLLFEEDGLRFFNGILPEGDSRVVAVCDVAWGGGDSLSMPIGREYENGDVYIFDWVFNKGAKEETVPIVCGKIVANEIRQINFEGNVGGAMYSYYIDEKLQEQGYKCNCTEKKAPNKMSKVEKIMAYSGDIKRRFIFLAPNGKADAQFTEDSLDKNVVRYRRSADYQKAMEELQMFVTVGKNPHDDAADSLTQLAMFIEGTNSAKVELFDRRFIGI